MSSYSPERKAALINKLLPLKTCPWPSYRVKKASRKPPSMPGAPSSKQEAPRCPEIKKVPITSLTPGAFLKEEIQKAKSARLWQAVLYATNCIIGRMWCSLREEDKEEFLSSYFSVFMSYRVSIPSENAEKILSYLLSGQVKIASGKHLVVGYDSDGVDIEYAGGSVHQYSTVINAVGSPRDVTQLDSLLVRNLLSRK